MSDCHKLLQLINETTVVWKRDISTMCFIDAAARFSPTEQFLIVWWLKYALVLDAETGNTLSNFQLLTILPLFSPFVKFIMLSKEFLALYWVKEILKQDSIREDPLNAADFSVKSLRLNCQK